MKNSSSSPPIAEAVGFLSEHAPEELQRLKSVLPDEMQQLLVRGGLAGPVPATLKSRATVQLAALRQIRTKISKSVVGAEKRLRLARRTRLIGDIAAVLGSSSVLAGNAGAVAGEGLNPKIAIAVSGIVALLGALAGVLSDYATRLPEGGGGSLFEVYSSLGEARYEAEVLIGEIEALVAAQNEEDVDAPLQERIGEANALCRKMQKSFAQTLKISS